MFVLDEVIFELFDLRDSPQSSTAQLITVT